MDRDVPSHDCQKPKDFEGGHYEHMVFCILRKVEGFYISLKENERRCVNLQPDAYLQFSLEQAVRNPNGLDIEPMKTRWIS